MKTAKIIITQLVIALILVVSCNQKQNETNIKTEQTDITQLEKEIELRLREYENHLQNGDSIALGNMYMLDAEIIPSTIGRENIITAFSGMIRDSITGSSFTTTGLWGNDELLVEQGTGSWSHENGQVIGRGQYLLVWKKNEGKWKILRDTWFPDKK